MAAHKFLRKCLSHDSCKKGETMTKRKTSLTETSFQPPRYAALANAKHRNSDVQVTFASPSSRCFLIASRTNANKINIQIFISVRYSILDTEYFCLCTFLSQHTKPKVSLMASIQSDSFRRGDCTTKRVFKSKLFASLQSTSIFPPPNTDQSKICPSSLFPLSKAMYEAISNRSQPGAFSEPIFFRAETFIQVMETMGQGTCGSISFTCDSLQ